MVRGLVSTGALLRSLSGAIKGIPVPFLGQEMKDDENVLSQEAFWDVNGSDYSRLAEKGGEKKAVYTTIRRDCPSTKGYRARAAR